MLPKQVYSKIVQSLRDLKKSWDQDRVENPNQVPYEIDMSLRAAIERHVREGRVNCYGRQDMAILVDQTIEYLAAKGLIVKSPYGGHMFQVPVGTVLPTKEQFIKQTEAKLDRFFGKPKDFTDD